MTRMICLTVVICLLASPALAAVTAMRSTVIDNSLGGAAFAGFVTNDVEIDFAGQYTGSQAFFQLTSGSVYQDALGSASPPNQIVVNLFPSLGFDSFVAQGSDRSGGPFGDPSIFGGAVDLGGAPTAVFNTSTINQTWHPPGGNFILNKSSFMIARFTLSKDANGTAKFLASAAQQLSFFDFPIRNGLIGVPEPTGAVLAGLAGIVLALRRPRRRINNGR